MVAVIGGGPQASHGRMRAQNARAHCRSLHPPRPMLAGLTRGVWFATALLDAVVWFAALDVRKLQHPDEGRYAEIAREMVVTGDWVTPRLDGVKYFEKPPLQYW